MRDFFDMLVANYIVEQSFALHEHGEIISKTDLKKSSVKSLALF